jgi:hypothetical protein
VEKGDVASSRNFAFSIRVLGGQTVVEASLAAIGLGAQHTIESQTRPDHTLPSVAVVVATRGRPQIASETIRRIIQGQDHKAALVIASCVVAEDLGEVASWPEVTVVTGPAGLAAQRNTALAAVPNSIHVVVFFDDDFVPEANWLGVAARTFRDQADVVSFTGNVLADGIKGPGLSFGEVDRLLQELEPARPVPLIESFSPYGCNMAFRRAAIEALRFDERLVLYGWLEDRDFGATLAAKGGRLVKSMEARGVHMGVKSGRIAGDRLGYSQVINPIYMLKKGTMTKSQVAGQLFRNLSINIARSIKPEQFIDRRGRLRGNFRGFLDLFSGYIEPERAAELKKPSQVRRARPGTERLSA